MQLEPYPISSEFHTIYLRDKLGPGLVRSMCVTLHNVIAKKGYKDITLDFSQCKNIYEAFMVPVLPDIVGYRQNGVELKLILPRDEKLRRLFHNANWAHYIIPQEFEKNDYEGGHIPVLQFFKSDDTSELVGRVIELVLGQIEGLQRGQLKALEWSLQEITDNVLQHAQSRVGGFVQATAYGNDKQVEFVVADGGIGIPNSLGVVKNPRLALEKAIGEGTTRDPNSNAGNGLYGSYRIALISQGAFEINSDKAHLICGYRDDKADWDLSVESEKIPYRGTSVRCRIGFDNPDLLAEALRFSGQPHDPPYDYLERTYENTEGSDITFPLAEHLNAVHSREGGQMVRTKLENLLNDAPHLTVDLSGVNVISSSFADEVFGRLFVKIGPMAFMNRLTLSNVDKTTRVLVDRAILQRTQAIRNENSRAKK